MFAVNKKRGLVQLLYSVRALVFGASHSGAGLMGGRFRCLKYWVTCWGSSARTDLASVSLGAWQRTRAREHYMNPDKHLEYWWLLSLLLQHRETSQVLPWADVCAMSPQSFSFLQFKSQRLCCHIYKTHTKKTHIKCLFMYKWGNLLYSMYAELYSDLKKNLVYAYQYTFFLK